MAENTENKYLNKVPPHDNDAEQAVLACMLFDNEGARIAIEGLDSQDFYSPAHQLIFSAISDLYNAYISLTNCATDPSGSLQTYSSTFNDADTNMLNAYKAMQLYIDD